MSPSCNQTAVFLMNTGRFEQRGEFPVLGVGG